MSDGKNVATRIVLEVVCKHYGLNESEVFSEERSGSLSLARKVAYRLLREHFYFSFPQIGGALNRDHTTVMKGISSLMETARVDRDLQKALRAMDDDVRLLRLDMYDNDAEVRVMFTATAAERLQQLLDGGLYGRTIGDVVERLVCRQLETMESAAVAEPTELKEESE